MYHIVLTIQIINIVVTFAECWVVFRNWKGTQHSYLFFACVATLVNDLGYYFQLRAHSVESYLFAFSLSAAGRVWVTFALFMFVTELVRVKVPGIARLFMSLFNVVSYIIMITTLKTGLYYNISSFQIRDGFPVLIRTNGWWHHIWSAVIVLYAFYGLMLLFIAYSREKNKTSEKKYLMVMLAMATMSSFVIIQLFKPLPFFYLYDMTMLSFPIAAVFMFIAIFRYNLMDSATLAREYVIDRLSEAIIAVDDTGEISYKNDPALSVFPHLTNDPHSVIDTIRSAMESNEPIRIGERIYTPESSSLSSCGVSAGTIYTITDDTQHYKYMEQLEEQKRMADEANRAKSAFLANMSHEIRTPINAVLGMDEMIIRESGEKSIRAYAKDIKTAGKTLLSLINDILDFSKIEEGRMEIIPTQYDLSSVINDLVNMIRPRAQKKGLKFELSVDRNVPHILYGDEIRIKQVVINLLTNAAKYTNEGYVRLVVGFSKKDDDHIMLSFAVEDSGVGMKKEDMDKLFSPFSRIDEKKNRSVEGTGLGMSIVRQLLDLMGSSVNVDSVYGKGSTFSFEIEQKVIGWEPMGDISDRFIKDEDDTAVYHELFQAPDANILVVDDTEVNLSVICNLLKQTRIKINTATSGLSAISLAKEKHFDMIFIDHMMPDMDGIETLKYIREECDCTGCACIALTANAVSGAREMYLDAGFSDYISKPVDGRRLEEMIRKYLPEDKVRIPDKNSIRTATNSDDSRGTILIVDDDEVILATAQEILGSDFNIIVVSTGEEALNATSMEKPDLILLDVNLVGMNGFEVLDALKKERKTRDIPVMFITADDDREKEAMGLKNGAQDFIRKPFIPEVLVERSRRIITLDRYSKDLKGEVRKQTNRAKRLTMEMMLALSHTVDAKDHYTKGHSERVAAYAAEIGRRMGKTPEEQKELYEIGLLHDIGKIGIPEEIINKTERLTDEEFARIKEHTLIGCEILNGIVDMPALASGARSHHERYDGKGYPDGLARDAIPEVARIICVADCYDAMTSTRTYSTPKPQEKVRAEIERCSGSQFDPDVAAIMRAMIDEDKDYIMNERTGGCDVWKGYTAIWNADDITSSVGDNDANPASGKDKIPAWLKDIPEMDIKSGIANCGSGESFMSVLTVFHKTAKQKADEIEKLHASGDIENYTIKVHALKSSARIIGAAKLSDAAKDLETAGKAGDRAAIDADTGALLEMYRNLDKKLEALDGDETGKKELSASMRREAFSTITEIAKSMDYGMMETVLKDLNAYALSEEDAAKIKQIEDAMMQLDWDTIEAVASKEI